VRLRALIFAALLLAGGLPKLAAQTPAREANTVADLKNQLVALSPRVRSRDAQRVATVAHETARALRREYGVAGPAQFHNVLVNVGAKKRGLCHHWTRDLMQRLHAQQLATLDLHWGQARAGTWREHNAVVVTARGAPFASGVVLDPWRHGGRLFSGRVATDRYPWKEDLVDCLCARRRAQLAARP